MNRMRMVAILAAALAADSLSLRAQAKAPSITVYKDPSCGCCSKWIDHLRQHGFETKTIPAPDVSAVKKKNNVPDRTRSCHTALVGGYVIEGHVPAADIQQLLKKRPSGVIGLAVPGMPMGSPGMEVPGGQVQSYDVLAFDKEGRTTVFASHGR